MKNARNIIAIFLLTTLCLSCSSWHGALQMRLNGVYWGGRAVAVTYDPSNNDNVWVATETGGVFHSTNGGYGWTHVDSLPFECFDIKICPSNRKIIVATFARDYRAENGAGIWLSTDAGVTWGRPKGVGPLDQNGKRITTQAYGIAYRSNSNYIYVGTDYGLAVSSDLGVSWTNINPAPSVSNYQIFSVAVTFAGRVLTYGTRGVMYSDEPMTTWFPAVNMATYEKGIPNAFAISPWNKNHIFFTNNDGALFYSLDGGNFWMPIRSVFTLVNPGSRHPFVKVVKSLSEKSGELDLYYAQYAYIGKKTIKWTGSNFDFTAGWEVIPLHHSDPSDLAFTIDNKPLYETSDGGVAKSILDETGSWTHVGRADNGFNALQVYDVKTIFDKTGKNANNIYFGTQDNDFWASDDGGNTWPQACCVEGLHTQGPVDNSIGDGKVTFTSTSTDTFLTRTAGPLFNGNSIMKLPANNYQNPPEYVGPQTYFIYTINNDGSYNLMLTKDNGATWRRTYTLEYDVYDYSHVSGPANNPSIFTPVGTGIGNGLLKIDNALNDVVNDEKAKFIPLPQNCILNYAGRQSKRCVTFGVDPNDPKFIIVTNQDNTKIYLTRDSGQHWEERNDILNIIKFNGKYIPQQRGVLQPISIVFDPKNSNRILIGCAQSGVIYSDDHGINWSHIRKTEQIPYIFSLSFIDDKTAIAASYGRGLWKIRLEMLRVTRRIPPLEANTNIITLEGDQAEARRMRGDTMSARMMLRNEEGKPVTMVPLGSAPVLQGRRFSSLKESPLVFMLDGDTIQVTIKILDNGTFSAQLPKFYNEAMHELKAFQGESFLSRIYFTVVPIDNEDKEDNKRDFRKKKD